MTFLMKFKNVALEKLPTTGFFDKILTETELQFFAKLRKIGKTEKYEIFRYSTFSPMFQKLQILLRIRVFLTSFSAEIDVLALICPFPRQVTSF